MHEVVLGLKKKLNETECNIYVFEKGQNDLQEKSFKKYISDQSFSIKDMSWFHSFLGKKTHSIKFMKSLFI